jgi:hypothetical protein
MHLFYIRSLDILDSTHKFESKETMNSFYLSRTSDSVHFSVAAAVSPRTGHNDAALGIKPATEL